MKDYRIELDFLGKKEVPKKAYYGISTVRSFEVFGGVNGKMPLELVYAITQIKKACAKANYDLHQLGLKEKNAIIRACNEVLAKKFDDQFILGVLQSGSGTATHMNVNEVIGNLANEIIFKTRTKKRVDAHDHVNMAQSTNNVFPSAIRIASMQLLEELEETLKILHFELKGKAKEFRSVIKSGRTHLQDAIPITLGQEFGAYARTIEKHRNRVRESKAFLRELGVGGTAVGTGLNTFPLFRKKVIANLNKQTKTKFKVAENGVEATQFLTDLAAVSSALKLLAVDLNKIAFDLRLMGSGPNTGFGEIVLPAVEPGSSIMPGKVNPSVLECVNMCSLQVMGNDVSISMACANGVLELNTHAPLIAVNLIESLKLVNSSCKILAKNAIKGIKANKEMCRCFGEHSAALGTVLNPLIGYTAVSELIKESQKTGISIKELAIKKGFLSKAEAKKIFSPPNLTKPNRALFKKKRT